MLNQYLEASILFAGFMLIYCILWINLGLPFLYLTMPRRAFEEMKQRYRHWDSVDKRWVATPWIYGRLSKWNAFTLSHVFFHFCAGAGGLRGHLRNRFDDFDFSPLLPRWYRFLLKVFIVSMFSGAVVIILSVPALWIRS